MKKKNARFLAAALCGTAGLIWSVVTILHVVVNSSVQLVLLNFFARWYGGLPVSCRFCGIKTKNKQNSRQALKSRKKCREFLSSAYLLEGKNV